MDEIIERYNKGKFQKCLELIKLLPKTDDLTVNLLRENCVVVCESIISTLQNDFDKIMGNQEKLYILFDKVTSLGTVSDLIPFELKLTVTYNLIYWLLFFNGDDLNNKEKEEYLCLVSKGLQRVTGNDSSKPCGSIVDKITEVLLVLKRLIPRNNNKTGILISELITIILLYILKLKRSIVDQYARITSLIARDVKQCLTVKSSIKDLVEKNPNQLCLFKFGLNKIASLFEDDNLDETNYLYLLESCLLYLTGNYKGSLLSLQKNSNCSIKSFYNYLGALNSFEIGNFNLCLDFITKGSSLTIQPALKARLCILEGKMKCLEKNHKEALKCFESALSLFPDCPLSYYYAAQEYGEMGLNDMVLTYVKRLVKVIEISKSEKHERGFESLLLDWIHPENEVTKVSALYTLASCYALNEQFNEASEILKSILGQLNDGETEVLKGVIPMPSYVTILHDASIMNLLTGNLAKSEQLALDAAEYYTSRELSKKSGLKNCFFSKDINWLEKTIQGELLGNNLDLIQSQTDVRYQEDLIFIFSQNVVALLIISEIHRIQKDENYRISLSQILSIFSSYLASMSQKEPVSKEEKNAWDLVKALASKVCVKTASVLLELNDEVNVEKMYKRALSSNKGDKDALYHYFEFLISRGKNREGFKLWQTFYKQEALVKEDNVQSFALKYFLADKITKHELKKVQDKVDSMMIEFC